MPCLSAGSHEVYHGIRVELQELLVAAKVISAKKTKAQQLVKIV